MKKFLEKLTSKKIFAVLLISFLLHFSIAMLIYYTGFRPFGGGADYEGYSFYAETIANNFRNGNFSLDKLRYGHDFPLIIGVIYFLTVPNINIGLLLISLFFAISVYLVYKLIIQLGGTEKTASLAALAVNLYPSYAYFGSLLLKDTLVIPLVLLSVLLIVKMVSKFSVMDFLLFFLLCVAVDYLRFYIGYALIFAFIFSWFLFSKIKLKKIVFGIVLTLLI